MLMAIVSIPGFIVGIAFHEYAHAWMADRMGDPTPRMLGRLTLEPWVHLDPIGSILLLFFGFGWAKPVSINPYNFDHPREGILKVSLAGPVMNVIVAMAFSLLSRFATLLPQVPYLQVILNMGVIMNIGLAVFNLIPIPPLDGSKILSSLLPVSRSGVLDQLDRYGQFILILLLYSGLLSPVLGVLTAVIRTFVEFVVGAVTWFIP